MNPNLGLPTPQIGMVNSTGIGNLTQQPNFNPVQMSGQGTGGMNWMGMLPMLQGLLNPQQGQQSPPMVQPPGLLMPGIQVPQFQVSPLSGLFGLHRGV